MVLQYVLEIRYSPFLDIDVLMFTISGQDYYEKAHKYIH